jgi:trehalose-6-phosphate synthase
VFQTTQHPYAEQRQLIECPKSNRRAQRLISITYNEAYSTPVLWFNFYDSINGKILHLEDFEAFISTNSASSDILKGLSQNEHPVHGIAFYNVHPCKTNEFMSNLLTTRNYIIR